MKIIHNKNNYHVKQYRQPYYSTIAFVNFLRKNHCILPNTNILDIGSGAGANIYYLAKHHTTTNFIGQDYNQQLIRLGNTILKNYNQPNIKLEFGDWFKLSKAYKNYFDGIFNIHTLCVFKHLEPTIKALVKLKPRWIAFNSLFYEGPLDVLIHIRENKPYSYKDNDPDGDFNIFSLIKLEQLLKSYNYNHFIFEKFHIPVDLPKPTDNGRGTYTIKTALEKRSHFSGPVYLPWYFVCGIKTK
jgi:SAM-dependent methyltransferase